jgi:hypothetical protein
MAGLPRASARLSLDGRQENVLAKTIGRQYNSDSDPWRNLSKASHVLKVGAISQSGQRAAPLPEEHVRFERFSHSRQFLPRWKRCQHWRAM